MQCMWIYFKLYMRKKRKKTQMLPYMVQDLDSVDNYNCQKQLYPFKAINRCYIAKRTLKSQRAYKRSVAPQKL